MKKVFSVGEWIGGDGGNLLAGLDYALQPAVIGASSACFAHIDRSTVALAHLRRTMNSFCQGMNTYASRPYQYLRSPASSL